MNRREATTRISLPLGHRIASFDSVFAPPAGLEPATGRLTPPFISLIEDTLQLPPFL